MLNPLPPAPSPPPPPSPPSRPDSRELVVRVIAMHARTVDPTRGKSQRWVHVKRMFSCSADTATEICRRYGFDPDTLV